MTPQTLIASDPIDVHREIAELRLTLDIIHRALETGYVRRSFCTENTPVSIPGVESWRWTVEELRSQVVVPGSEWRRSDIEGLPVIANDERRIVIGVVTGDGATGLLHRKPKPKNKKGVVVKMATVENGGQIDMFEHTPDRQNVYDFAGYGFWLLLLRTHDGAVFAELSCPSVYSEKQKKVVDWSRRIIIPPVLPDETGQGVPEMPADDFDFELTKKIA